MDHIEGPLSFLSLEIEGQPYPHSLYIFIYFFIFLLSVWVLHWSWRKQQHDGSSWEKREGSCCIGFTLVFAHDCATCASYASIVTDTHPTPAGAGQQRTIPTSMGHFQSYFTQWEPLVATSASTLRSLVTHTNKCGWAINGQWKMPWFLAFAFSIWAWAIVVCIHLRDIRVTNRSLLFFFHIKKCSSKELVYLIIHSSFFVRN